MASKKLNRWFNKKGDRTHGEFIQKGTYRKMCKKLKTGRLEVQEQEI